MRLFRVLPVVFLGLVSANAWADEVRPVGVGPVRVTIPSAPVADPARFAARDAHLAYETKAMSTLMTWAAASVLTGTMLTVTGGDDYTRAVGVQNIAWGAIDGVIAGFGYRGIRKKVNLDNPISYWQIEDKKLRKIFLINAGLDVLYIATGAALMGFGKTDFVRGSGAGVILQGSFLFAFDSAMGFGVK
jgi:hypothetical protein